MAGGVSKLASTHYVIDTGKDSNLEKLPSTMKRLHKADTNSLAGDNTILVHEESVGSETFCAARDQTCNNICNTKLGYKASTDGYGSGACYVEKISERSGEKILTRKDGTPVDESQLAVGYTQDCFIDDYVTTDNIKNEFAQCVCDGPKEELTQLTAREAAKAEADSKEKYVYRQDRLYKESLINNVGTYYPKERYYNRRDVSGAFGTNHIMDYTRPGKEKFAEVNPNTQHLSTWTSACLSGIYAQLSTLKNLLTQLDTCIEEAKYTGFQDAGMCKTIFSENICGLFYKVLASGKNSCVPKNLNDVPNEGEGINYLAQGANAYTQALDSSIKDLEDDYNNAALSSSFSAGSGGITQSICMAAFGFDFPMGTQLFTDAAFSIAQKTSAQVFPANREFSNFNPVTGQVSYNYEVATLVTPGCPIARLDTYLTCVGPTEVGEPGVNCLSGECDCLNAQGTSPFTSERTVLLPGGSGNNIPQGGVIDLPIESPQNIDSHFRYDHVMVKMTLEQNYDAESCFDEANRVGENQAVFYYPIRDLTPGAFVGCEVSATSGQVSCPELSSLFFQGGFAYLESPYLACYNKATGSYGECNVANQFTLEDEDEIRLKTHFNLDDNPYCLQVKTSGGNLNYGTQMIQLPAGRPGQYQPEINLGKVSSSMFGAVGVGLTRLGSDSGCASSLDGTKVTDASIATTRLEFKFTQQANAYRLEVSPKDKIELVGTDKYHLNNGVLTENFGGATSIPITTINGLKFTAGGVEFDNVLNNVVGNGQCNYVPRDASSGSSANERYVDVTVTLMEADSYGTCSAATKAVQTQGGFGKASDHKRILIQKEKSTTVITNPLHEVFQQGDYVQAQNLAEQLILANPGELDEAVGIFYLIAASIAPIGSNWRLSHKTFVIENLGRFFKRLDRASQGLVPFSPSDINTGEFQAIRAYMCDLADTLIVESQYSTTIGGRINEEYGCSGIPPSLTNENDE